MIVDAAAAADVLEADSFPEVGTKVGLFVTRDVGAATGNGVVGCFVGAGVGLRVSTFVVEVTANPLTLSEVLKAAAKSPPDKDDDMSLEYASSDAKLVAESDATTENKTSHVYDAAYRRRLLLRRRRLD